MNKSRSSACVNKIKSYLLTASLGPNSKPANLGSDAVGPLGQCAEYAEAGETMRPTWRIRRLHGSVFRYPRWTSGDVEIGLNGFRTDKSGSEQERPRAASRVVFRAKRRVDLLDGKVASMKHKRSKLTTFREIPRKIRVKGTRPFSVLLTT